MLDLKQAEAVVRQLQHASEPKPIDPALPIELARARREVELAFASADTGRDLWKDASSIGLLGAGLAIVARWFRKSAGEA
jgi:hypothetical protein